KLSFKGIISKNNQLLASESAFNTVDLEFISTNGSWNITNNFSAKNIKVENSSLHAANKSITITSIDISIGSENNVDFSGSVIKGLDFIDVSAGIEVNFDNSLILFSDANGNNIKSIKGGGNTFHNIQVQSAELSISGNNTFNKIFVDGLLMLTGDNTIDSLRLSDVSSLTLSENSTQTINNSFDATGSVSNLIEIASSGASNAAIFADNSNIRFCFDYLDVVNVSVSGGTDFLSGDNSNINSTSTGWIELDCDDALFPSFEIEFPCSLGEVRFVDTSTGFPTNWSWNFGNLQFPEENTSAQQNPFHNYRFEGEYEVTFNVKNSQFDQTIIRTVTIIDYESGLGVPSININGTKLTSSVIAPNYQWYVNNSPIPGATDRIYEIANPGTYHVTVSDENCLFRSEATTVTSSPEEVFEKPFTIYPNPSSGIFTLKMISGYNGIVEIMIYDLLGNNLINLNFTKNKRLLQKQFSLSDLPGGIYNILMNIEGGQYIEKLVIKY
ncbi:MAG: T9SS type A sorting domain-containing protein, partial [Cyclobacteriaceae bacterium]|nr:T9SS type A sorting domain-containing protein [Cyclobacteriaceae bacterium]